MSRNRSTSASRNIVRMYYDPPFDADYITHASRSRWGFRNPPRFDNQPATHFGFSPYCPTTSLGPYSAPVPAFPNTGTQVATNTSMKENGYVTELNDDHLDEEMTTPVPSSGPSRNASVEQQADEKGHSCSCPNTLPSMVSAANTPSGFSAHMDRAVLPNHPLPGFGGLFNPHSSVQVHNYNGPPRETPLTPEASAVGAPSLSNLSALSTISSSTIQAPLSIAARRSSLLAALYNICLDASADYTHSLPQPSRRRAPGFNMRGVLGDRYHPYATQRAPYLQSRFGRSGEPSLMDYISMISTHLWRKARSDLLAPHQAEAVAVQDMRDLYAWGELLIRGVDHQRPHYEEDDIESDGEVWMDERRDMKVVEVAKTLCRWFGDQEALSACRRVSLELKELEKEQASPRRVSADESLDGFGSIL